MDDDVTPIRKPMTKQDCENYIMLKGQGNERWFEVRILDEDIGQDPNMLALMETVSDMIFAGMQGMPFNEAELARNKLKKKGLIGQGVGMAIVKPNGDAA